MATQMCDVCGIRPAVATVRRTNPDGERRGAAPVRGAPRRGAAAEDESVLRLWAGGAACSTTSSPTSSTAARAAGRAPAVSPRRAAQRRCRAGRHHRSSSPTPRASCSSGGPHARWSGDRSTSTPSTCCGPRCATTSCATSCGRPMAIPQAIAAQIEDEAEQGGRTDVAPSLSPEAKAALLAAYDEMRELNASYLGPRARAARAGARRRVRSRQAARPLRPLAHQAARRGHPRRRPDRGGRPPGQPDQDARPVQPRPHRTPRGRASSTPSSGAPTRSSRRSRSSRGAPRTTRC